MNLHRSVTRDESLALLLFLRWSAFPSLAAKDGGHSHRSASTFPPPRRGTYVLTRSGKLRTLKISVSEGPRLPEPRMDRL